MWVITKYTGLLQCFPIEATQKVFKLNISFLYSGAVITKYIHLHMIGIILLFLSKYWFLQTYYNLKMNKWKIKTAFHSFDFIASLRCVKLISPSSVPRALFLFILDFSQTPRRQVNHVYLPSWLCKSNELTVECCLIICCFFKYPPTGLARNKTSGRNWIDWLNCEWAGFQDFIMFPTRLLFMFFPLAAL